MSHDRRDAIVTTDRTGRAWFVLHAQSVPRQARWPHLVNI